jgi:hypothetical protein
MDIVTLMLVIVFVGVVLYCINRFIPMDANIKQILNIVVIVALVIWLLNVFGVFARLSTVHIGG